MFDRFSDNDKRAMSAARQAAQALGHDSIGTEHILLGLCAGSTNTAGAVLADLAVDPESVRWEVEKLVQRGDAKASGQLPFTPRSKRVLELAFEAADDLEHNYIGTEHMLLGLIKEGHGLAARALAQLGVDFESAREAISRIRPKGSAGPTNARAVREALLIAVAEALGRGHAEVDVPHVLLALLELDSGFAAQWMEKVGIDLQRARQSLHDVLDELEKT